MIKESFHADLETRPWAEHWASDPGIRLQLLMADIEGQRFAVRMQFEPGLLAIPHKHTGEVHAITRAGKWSYLEYPHSPYNMAGSYLFEPPGTAHTLKVADDAGEVTDVIFIIYGAMLHLDEGGNVVAVTDAHSVISEYSAFLQTAGFSGIEKIPIGGQMNYRDVSDIASF
ncbi:2,4'-dihydroxyacetophenone dioxygenase family protein [Sphingobium nicotianae]|uniref:2,4'-dihydroxyacetophenone dioxygenase family protein n=1 Tax=Sphingobium nicotianae TaxID=2782607 RepID=A0A9X1D9W0_9SPHN|nr:2,4'-dihydroxyacetophenone dioxygenase family protein [Sphingobium nicotianae]MBT2186071.1 2,4'-dihydroxyacetophenone dioxygenase family protein [Sphingobium nicotianae]